MKSPIIILTTFLLSIFSFSSSSSLSAKEIINKKEVQNYSSQLTLVSSHLTYVRVYKDGKWFICVYDGTELVDVYPE
ncbi:MAG: hypothetical protein M3R36_12370 [Bacteroidota bacterium]|nr:hypothetical protein [Bacteroidota bacterium]